MLMIDKINFVCRKGRKIVKEIIFLDQIVLFLSNFKKIFQYMARIDKSKKYIY